MQVEFGKKFDKQLKRSSDKIKRAFQQRLILFIEDRYHPLLENHSLTGKWRRYRSINITGDWRAVFKEFQGGAIVYFAELGTHSQLYK